MIITELSSSEVFPEVLSPSYYPTMSEASERDVDSSNTAAPQPDTGLTGASGSGTPRSNTVRRQSRDSRLRPEASNTYTTMNMVHKARDLDAVKCQTSNEAKSCDSEESLGSGRGEKRARTESEADAELATTKSRKTSIPARSLPAACKNPASVAKRNARERRRIKNVNLAFDELRQHVPSGEQNKKKISKVDTLQSAIEYIKALENLIKRKRMLESSAHGEDRDESDGTESAISSSTDDICLDSVGSPTNIATESESVEIASDRDAPSSLSSAGSLSSFQDDDVIVVSSTGPTNKAVLPASNPEVYPMLREFDSALEKCAELNRRGGANAVGTAGNMAQCVPQYFDDSGFSDDSATTQCEQRQPMHPEYAAVAANVTQESLSAFPRVGPTPPAQHSAVLNEVSADDIQKLLDGNGSPNITSAAPGTAPLYAPVAFDFIPPVSFGVIPPMGDCGSGQAQQCFVPSFMSSTPRVDKNGADDAAAFVFPTATPTQGSQHWSYSVPEYVAAPTAIPLRCEGAIASTSFEGYRFGDTLG